MNGHEVHTEGIFDQSSLGQTIEEMGLKKMCLSEIKKVKYLRSLKESLDVTMQITLVQSKSCFCARKIQFLIYTNKKHDIASHCVLRNDPMRKKVKIEVFAMREMN